MKCINCGQPASFTTPTGHDVCAQCANTGPTLSDVLDDLSGLISRYIVFTSDHQLVAVTLWAAHTHLAHRLRTTPYLHITSPEKESGKSQLLDVLEPVVHNPWLILLPSPAVVFRKIDKAQEDGGLTLLLDEVDGVFKRGADEAIGALREVLNAGYQKGRTVPRCVGPSQQLVDFQVYGPKALAGIGEVPDTIAGRSIRIGMKRRKPSEKVESFFPDEIVAETESLRERLAEKVAGVDLGDLRQIRRELLQRGLGDRAADIWSSLIAIADEAGGSWPKWARRAASELSARRTSESDGLGIRLLEDCRDVLEAWEHEHIWSVDLRAKLLEIEDAPWSDYKGGEISPRTIAWLLHGYEVPSGDRRIGDKVRKGYRIEDFSDAFSRYLASEASQALHPPSPLTKSGISQALHNPDVADSKSAISSTSSKDVAATDLYMQDRRGTGSISDAIKMLAEEFTFEEES